MVDEFAHANLPGDRHAKRWQDIDELLASGIDVYTALNVANIESLGQAVSRITGVRPAEPVPDAFVRSGEVKLVDLTPAALRHRLAQGPRPRGAGGYGAVELFPLRESRRPAGARAAVAR